MHCIITFQISARYRGHAKMRRRHRDAKKSMMNIEATDVSATSLFLLLSSATTDDGFFPDRIIVACHRYLIAILAYAGLNAISGSRQQ